MKVSGNENSRLCIVEKKKNLLLKTNNLLKTQKNFLKTDIN